MPETKSIIINTGPLLALVAGVGNFDILKELYSQVIVPNEVCDEILTGSPGKFGVKEFQEAVCLVKIDKPVNLSSYLASILDKGEAAVIQYAIDNNIKTVCIDEVAGRRVARLSGLKVTGSIGILLRAKENGINLSVLNAIEKMKQRGIWISKTVEDLARKKANE